jgi:hypothetical protein
MRKVNNRTQVRCGVVSCWRTFNTIKSPPFPFQDDRRAPLTNISVRRERQLVHAYGPAWRYMRRDVGDALASPAVTPDDPPSDPLEAFLAMHADEGPAIAAMWTSLHRSCTQYSEITESAVVAVRRLFHNLVRSRAFLAAAQLYRRLGEYGLALKNHDVLLLLTNLPYEKSVGSASEISQGIWMSSGDPTSWKRKKEAEARVHKRPLSHNASTPVVDTKHVAGNSTSPRVSGRWLERLRVYEAAMGHATLEANPVDSSSGTFVNAFDSTASNQSPPWKNPEAIAALIHHLCFVHSQSQIAPVSKDRGVWVEALHVFSAELSAQKTSSIRPVVMPSVLFPAAACAFQIVPPALQWKVAVRLIANNVRGSRTLENELLRTLSVKLCPTLNSPVSRRPLGTVRKAVDVILERLGSTSGDPSTYHSIAMASLIDRCRTSPTRQMLQSVQPALIQMLNAQIFECERHFRVQEPLGDSHAVETHHRFIPCALEENIALCTSAVRATASLLPLVTDLNRSFGSHSQRTDELARAAFFGDAGLVALRELLFSSKHRSSREIKAIKNSPERNVISNFFLQAGLAWLMMLPRTSRYVSISVHTVSGILSWLAEILGDMNLCADRSHVQRDVLTVVSKVILHVGLHQRGNHSTLEASLAHQVLTDRFAMLLCTSVIRLIAAVLPLKSRSHATNSLRVRSALRVVLILSNPSNPAGKLVRSQLSTSHARHLDTFSIYMRRSHRAKCGVNVGSFVGRPFLWKGSNLEILRRNVGDVYSVASDRATTEQKSAALQKLMEAKSDWLEAAILTHSILSGVRISSNLIPTSVYLTAIERLSVPQPGEHVVPLPAWSAAIRCYQRALQTIPRSDDRPYLKIETIDKLVLPMLRVSVSCGQHDEARALNDNWLRFHATRSVEFQLSPDRLVAAKIRHALELRERDVLQRVVHYLSCSGSEGLKSELTPFLMTATQHSCQRNEWLRAIRLLDSHPVILTTPTGVLCYLHCLNSSGANLYHTCRNVFRNCGGNSWWTAEHSALVLRSFSRARRWQEALSLFSSPTHVNLHLSSEAVIKEGLRACAAGGRPEAAEALFNAYTELSTTAGQTTAMKALLFRAMTKSFAHKSTTISSHQSS